MWTLKKIREAYQTANARNAINNAMFAKTISLKEPKQIVITPIPYIVYKAFPIVVPNVSYT